MFKEMQVILLITIYTVYMYIQMRLEMHSILSVFINKCFN